MSGLEQFSKQLNVYDPSNENRARLSVNTADQFEVSYKSGLGSVLVKKLYYQDDYADSPHNLASEIYTIKDSVTAEAAARVSLMMANNDIFANEATQRFYINQRIDNEVAARTSAVTSVASALAQEVADRIGAVSTLTNSIANEASARSAADTVHSTTIAANTTFIINEAKRADDEEKRIVGLITTEIAARASADSIIVSSNTAFNTRAVNAEAALQTALDAEVTARGLALDQAQSGAATALGVESARAQAAEDALTVRINNVLSNINPAVIDSFSEVVTALSSSGGSLTTAVNNEAERALAIEGSLQAQITALLTAVLTLQNPY